MMATYDRIGVGYDANRRPDPFIAGRIMAALDGAVTVLNVGAGAGSYEPADRPVVALDASTVMLSQHRGTKRVQGVAEALPFPDQSFDAAMASITMQHWPDQAGGLAELRRVARRQVVFTYDAHHPLEHWVVSEYVPAIRDLDRGRFPTIDEVVDALDAHTVEPLPVAHDCPDGFQAAYWRRPERYLDPAVRASISTFALLPQDIVDEGMTRLAADLESGRWAREHADLLDRDEIDYGYRLIIAG
jgi:SAM-dependent methyltransferase